MNKDNKKSLKKKPNNTFGLKVTNRSFKIRIKKLNLTIWYNKTMIN